MLELDKNLRIDPVCCLCLVFFSHWLRMENHMGIGKFVQTFEWCKWMVTEFRIRPSVCLWTVFMCFRRILHWLHAESWFTFFLPASAAGQGESIRYETMQGSNRLFEKRRKSLSMLGANHFWREGVRTVENAWVLSPESHLAAYSEKRIEWIRERKRHLLHDDLTFNFCETGFLEKLIAEKLRGRVRIPRRKLETQLVAGQRKCESDNTLGAIGSISFHFFLFSFLRLNRSVIWWTSAIWPWKFIRLASWKVNEKGNSQVKTVSTLTFHLTLPTINSALRQRQISLYIERIRTDREGEGRGERVRDAVNMTLLLVPFFRTLELLFSSFPLSLIYSLLLVFASSSIFTSVRH